MIDFPEWGAGTGAFRLADEVARLQSVVAVQNEVSTSRADLSALLTLVASRAEDMTGASGAYIRTLAGDDLLCVVATGMVRARVGTRVPRATSLAGLALQTGEVLFSEDIRKDPRIESRRSDYAGLRSLIAVPLGSTESPFGVLKVVSKNEGGFGPEHIEMLRLLGGIMSARLELAAQLEARQALLAENAVTLAALRESESRFRRAFDDSGIGMALVGLDGRWLKTNATLCRITGYSQEEMLARNFQAIAHPDDVGVELELVQQMLSGEIATYERETRYLHKTGSTVWVQLTASLVKDAQGTSLYFVSQIQDITARKEAEAALLRLAVRDELTGLFNRREMDRLLHEEIARAHRHERSLSLLMVDIDWFKRINDTFGHQVGDRAIQQVAHIVRDSVRTLDRAARYGGEELAVILPETSAVEALVVAERIRTKVAEVVFGGDQGVTNVVSATQSAAAFSLTVSVGVGTMSPPAHGSVERLIRDADRALYAAKHRGRNRSVMHEESPEASQASATMVVA